MFFSFFDEFGHIGPFIKRSDRRYNQSPVFGLAGFIIPHEHVRHLGTWFYKQKEALLGPEIKRDNAHPATWEKKGSDLFTTQNIKKYPEIRRMAFRILNKINKLDGRVIYYGREKYLKPAKSNATGLYTTVLSHTIRNTDRYCEHEKQFFLMVLDMHDSRIRLLETAAKTMYGQHGAGNLIEPPFQVESHIYQTIQIADWIAAIIGRLMAYRVSPEEYKDWEWSERYFGKRLDTIATHSSLWRPIKN
jgi:hypothetical protein